MTAFAKTGSLVKLAGMGDTASLLAALPDASRTVLSDAGHAPWAERPADTRSLLIGALRPAPSAG